MTSDQQPDPAKSECRQWCASTPAAQIKIENREIMGLKTRSSCQRSRPRRPLERNMSLLRTCLQRKAEKTYKDVASDVWIIFETWQLQLIAVKRIRSLMFESNEWQAVGLKFQGNCSH